MINWNFIDELEGAAVATGYVPKDRNGAVLGASGVTIASGVDLGQRSIAGLWDMDLTPELTAALCCYATLTGDQAVQALEKLPLVLDDAQVRAIDQSLHDSFERTVAERWNSTTGDIPGNPMTWDSLTDQQQTVVMSVAWQYGTPWRRCPAFWRLATSGDWAGAVDELRDFGDDYPTRRGKEADYLQGGGDAR